MSNATTEAAKTPLNPDDLTFYAELNRETQSVAAENTSYVIRLSVLALV